MEYSKLISLYYRDSHSDKVYNASIDEVIGGYMVNFSYGRRGSALTSGSKTGGPVSLASAESIYQRLVNEKLSKGYKESTSAGTSSNTIVVTNGNESRDTGVRPQLLNDITEEEVSYYINSDDWCAQEKYDGRRRMIVITGDKIVGTNRKGLSLLLNSSISQDAEKLGVTSAILDGEDMGDYIMLFDLLITGKPYLERYYSLVKLFKNKVTPSIKIVDIAVTAGEKLELLMRLKRDNAEGIVFKRKDSLYVPGRPNSGGDQLKFKFCATASCIVSRVNPTKRSISLVVQDEDGHTIDVGNCTVYPNQDVPKIGEIVEVRYLYYFPGGSLFQSVLLGPREDMEESDCTLKQLKVKREEHVTEV